MTTQPSSSLSGYQRSARSLGAKAALPLAAGTAMLLSASPAHAQAAATRVTTGNVVNASNPHIYIDFDTLSVSPTTSPQADVRVYFSSVTQADHVVSGVGNINANNSTFLNQQYTLIAGQGLQAYKLADSRLVSRSLYINYHVGYFNVKYGNMSRYWTGASSGFIGLRFRSSVDHSNHYGWLQVGINADASEITLLAFGYNQTPDAGSLTGDGLAAVPVPEPATSAALLALGAAGLVAYRRRKNLQRASA